jgi:hypothetical protein
VHHLDFYGCDLTATFDDNKLPDGLCDDIVNDTEPCSSNVLTAWSIGGDPIMEYPREAGYSFGGDYGNKYYMITIHYDNPRLNSSRLACQQKQSLNHFNVCFRYS